jgi:hypothetical protein
MSAGNADTPLVPSTLVASVALTPIIPKVMRTLMKRNKLKTQKVRARKIIIKI